MQQIDRARNEVLQTVFCSGLEDESRVSCGRDAVAWQMELGVNRRSQPPARTATGRFDCRWLLSCRLAIAVLHQAAQPLLAADLGERYR